MRPLYDEKTKRQETKKGFSSVILKPYLSHASPPLPWGTFPGVAGSGREGGDDLLLGARNTAHNSFATEPVSGGP